MGLEAAHPGGEVVAVEVGAVGEVLDVAEGGLLTRRGDAVGGFAAHAFDLAEAEAEVGVL